MTLLRRSFSRMQICPFIVLKTFFLNFSKSGDSEQYNGPHRCTIVQSTSYSFFLPLVRDEVKENQYTKLSPLYLLTNYLWPWLPLNEKKKLKLNKGREERETLKRHFICVCLAGGFFAIQACIIQLPWQWLIFDSWVVLSALLVLLIRMSCWQPAGEPPSLCAMTFVGLKLNQKTRPRVQAEVGKYLTVQWMQMLKPDM